MPRTMIKIPQIMNTASQGNLAKNKVASAEQNIAGTRNAIDSKILARNNISGRLVNVQNSVAQIENQLAAICSAINEGALKYQNAENRVMGYANLAIYGGGVDNKNTNLSSKFSEYFHESIVASVLDDNTTDQKDEKKKNVWDYFAGFISGTDKVNSWITAHIPDEESILAFKMLSNGLKFGTKLDDTGKVVLQLDNFKNLTHTELSKVLKKYVTDAKLTDYDLRRLVNDGLPIYNRNAVDLNKKGKDLIDNVIKSTDDLLDLSGSIKNCNSITDKLKYAGSTFASTFAENMPWNAIEELKDVDGIFDFSGFKSLSKVEKVDDILVKATKGAKVLGVAGDILNAGVEIFENNYNPETQSWEITPQSVVSTVTDITIDVASSAGAAAAGAAVGSLIVPPVGTVVGTVAGIAIDAAINLEVFDFDGDGKKDSLVDGAKQAVDVATDAIIDAGTAAIDYIGKGIGSLADTIGGWFS